MAHALVHILGSRAGYTTLDATAGLSTADRAELEVLGFGDASGSEAMARLEFEPSMVGRRLRTGRFAISRMLPGGTDDKGRPTIEVVSLVLDSRGYASVVGALGRLAEDVRFWRLARGAVARGYELPEQASSASPREKGVLRAFDAWSAAREQGAIAVLSAGDASALLAMVGLLHAKDLDDCRWGVGVLSLSAPVDLCTLAPSTAAIGARPVLRAATGDAWLRPEMVSVVEFVEQNPLLPPREMLASAVRIDPALDRAASTRRYDAAASEYEAPARVSARPKSNLTAIAAVCALVSVALFVFTAAMYARDGRRVNVEVAPVPAAIANPEPAPGQPDGSTTVIAQGYSDFAEAGANSEATGAQQGKSNSVSTPPPANPGNPSSAALTQPEPSNVPPPSVPSQSAWKQTPEEEHSCPPGTRWVQLYLNEDHDSLGESLSERYECVLIGDPKAIGELWERGFALDSGDECPRNELRQKKGDCGCDWWEPWTQDERDACGGDEDGDGEPNLNDKGDDRVEARERMMACFRLAKEAADMASNWLKVARDLESQTKRELDPTRRRALANDTCEKLNMAETSIGDCVLHIARAQSEVDFGSRNFMKRGAPNVSKEICCRGDFADLESALVTLRQCKSERGAFNGLCGPDVWEQRLRESVAALPGRPDGKSIPSPMVDWAMRLLEGDGGLSKWIKALPDFRPSEGNRGKKPVSAQGRPSGVVAK